MILIITHHTLGVFILFTHTFSQNKSGSVGSYWGMKVYIFWLSILNDFLTFFFIHATGYGHCHINYDSKFESSGAFQTSDLNLASLTFKWKCVTDREPGCTRVYVCACDCTCRRVMASLGRVPASKCARADASSLSGDHAMFVHLIRMSTGELMCIRMRVCLPFVLHLIGISTSAHLCLGVCCF